MLPFLWAASSFTNSSLGMYCWSPGDVYLLLFCCSPAAMVSLCSSFTDPIAFILYPQLSQNRAPARLAVSQFGQWMLNGDPQLSQNFASSRFWLLQWGHSMDFLLVL
jgi:hypothetical protein